MNDEVHTSQAALMGYTVSSERCVASSLPATAISRLKQSARSAAVTISAVLMMANAAVASASCIEEGVRESTRFINPVTQGGDVSLHRIDRLRQTDTNDGWRIVDRSIDRVIDKCARDSGVDNHQDRRIIRDLIKQGIKILGQTDASQSPSAIERLPRQTVFDEMRILAQSSADETRGQTQDFLTTPKTNTRSPRLS